MDAAPGPPKLFLSQVNPSAELPKWPAQLAPETPPVGPQLPVWPTVTQETAVTKAPGQALLSRDCASGTKKDSHWIFSRSAFVLLPGAADNRTRFDQKWAKLWVECTVVR